MAGTFVRDTLAPDLLSGATLNSAGTSNGTIQNLEYPGEFGVELVSATASGTSPTLDVEIQASDSSTFASGVVSLGRFSRSTTATTKRMQFYTNKRYVRASVVVGGTSPSFASSTAKVVPTWDRFASDQTA